VRAQKNAPAKTKSRIHHQYNEHRMTWKAAARNTLVVFLLAAAYVGFRVYQRQAANAEFNERERKKRERPLPEILKTDKLQVLTFYASPPRIAAGEKSSLCYGVLNAKAVSAEPGIGELFPSISRCVQVSPPRTTEYTLKAVDAAGVETIEKTTLTVR
jgi:hypothetical protein